MEEINLLKPGLAEGRNKETHRLNLNLNLDKTQKILFLLICAFFLTGISLRGYSYYQKNNLNKVNFQYNKAGNTEKEIRLLTQERDKLESQISILNNYLTKNINWSDKLDQLRSFIPHEIWLNALSFDKRAGKGERALLYLKGGLITKDNTNSIAILSNFVNQLKTNEEFSDDFDNPALTDLHAEVKSGADTMVFIIEMPLQKEKEDLSLNETAK